MTFRWFLGQLGVEPDAAVGGVAASPLRLHLLHENARLPLRSRPNARCAVVTLVGGITQETVKCEKSAPYMRRRLLSGGLLKTNDVGCKIIQDRPENGYPTCEFHFVRSRPIKIFEIKCRNANGAYGARPK